MRAEIISVGTELLLGQIANTDAQFISRELAAIGIGTYYHTVVGDNWDRVVDAIAKADERCDVVIMTGGLGPTDDDLTKEALCHYLGLEMVQHQKSYDSLVKRFGSLNKPMSENNLKQVLFPECATVLDNDFGTAPGMLYEREDGKIFAALPGPPFELCPMFTNYALPILRAKTGKVLKSKVLRIYGIGESSAEMLVKDILREQTNPTVAPLLGNGDITFRITAMADNDEEAERLIAPVRQSLYERLGQYIYGEDDDTPEKVLVRELIAKGLTIATAESCSGGLIASRITDVSGSSAVFNEGFVTYANEAKMKHLGVKKETLDEFGAVSEQTAREMVTGLIAATGSDVAVAVTGIAGPTGGTPQKPVGLVYVGVAVRDDHGIRVNVTKNNFIGPRDKTKFNTATTAIINALKMINGKL